MSRVAKMPDFLGSFDRHWWTTRALLYGFLVLGAVILAGLLILEKGRLAFALAILTLLVGTSLVKPQLGIALTMVYLTLLGDIRRVLILFYDWSGSDPLVLIGAAVSGLLVVSAFANRLIRLDTSMSRALAFLMGLMALQIFNPKQGGLAVGVAGAIFYIVPLLWYWVGRTYATPAFIKQLLFGVILTMALLAAAFGIYQAFYGWLGYQEAWRQVAGYAALDVHEGTIRPISFFSSAEEFVYYVALALVLVWAYALHSSKVLLVLAPIFFYAMVLGGSRTPLVLGLFAMAMMWATQGRSVASWAPRLLLALVIGVAGLAWSLKEVAEASVSGQASAFVDRQVAGLSDPMNAENSTAGGHMWLFANGILEGFRNPLGLGLGATTIAASKFGGQATTTERDISNVFVSLGFVGGLCYLYIFGLAFRNGAQYWIKSQKLIALAIPGMMMVLVGQWLDGGLYCLSALTWLCIGALDRFHKDEVIDADRNRHQ